MKRSRRSSSRATIYGFELEVETLESSKLHAHAKIAVYSDEIETMFDHLTKLRLFYYASGISVETKVRADSESGAGG